MIFRIADFFCECDRILRFREPGHTGLHEGLKIVDAIRREFFEPLQVRFVIVAFNTDAFRQISQNFDIVAALVHWLDGLLHEDRVMPRTGPGRVDIVPLPECGGGQHDVGIAHGRRQEMILADDEFHIVERADRLRRVWRLVKEVAGHCIDEFDIGIATG